MTHAKLIERLEKAVGANDDLSVDVLKSLGERPSFGHVTNSIDATLALVERIGAGWSLHQLHHGKELWSAYVCDPDNFNNEFEGEHKSPAIAILIALLKAVEGED
jgi:hypothetical protein